jgi:hypothetical protein
MVTGRVALLLPVPKAVVKAFVMLAMNLVNQVMWVIAILSWNF